MSEKKPRIDGRRRGVLRVWDPFPAYGLPLSTTEARGSVSELARIMRALHTHATLHLEGMESFTIGQVTRVYDEDPPRWGWRLEVEIT